MKNGLDFIADRFVSTKASKLMDLVENKHFNIPHHQRDYSWEEKEINPFLNDIEKLKMQDFNDEKSLPHFIGAMVFIKNENTASFEIIDGQQRLTTTMLYFAMLKLISQNLTGIEQITVNARIHAYIYSSRLGQPLKTRLTLERAQIFYENMLQQQTWDDIEIYYNGLQVSKDVDKRIFNACELIYKYLEKRLEQFYNDNSKLYERIMQYLEAVQTMMVGIEIFVEQPGVAYTVFETLNARGKELSSANLIKNTLLSFAERQGTEGTVLNIWTNIIEEITRYDNIDITDFLRDSYYSRYGQFTKDNLFNEIKEKLETNQITAIDYINEVNEDYLPYLKFKLLDKNTDNYFTPSVYEKLDELNNYIKVTRIYPLLLSGRAVLSIKDFEDLVDSAVNFAFRYIVVMKQSADSLLNLITIWSTTLRQKTTDIDNIKLEMDNKASDYSFKQAFEIFAPGTQYQRFYIIKKIEDMLTGGQGITVLDQSPTQHLEHIMPQRPNFTDWPHLYVDPDKLDEKFSTYVNRIGNHTVLEKDINAHIKNKNFSYKNSNSIELDYQHSVLKLPKEIKNYLNNNQWNYDSIDARGKYLATQAIKVWSL